MAKVSILQEKWQHETLLRRHPITSGIEVPSQQVDDMSKTANCQVNGNDLHYIKSVSITAKRPRNTLYSP